MREKGLRYEAVMRAVDKLRSKDISWDYVYNSICSKPLDIGIKAYIKGLDTNLGDVRIFKGTAAAEQKVISLLSDFYCSSENAGNIVSGGTEANLLALYVARKSMPQVQEPEIIICDTVHYSVLKAVEFMNIKCRFVDHMSDFKVNVNSIRAAITERTIAIIATAGTSEFGNVDPIEEIAEIAYKNNIYFHVDAASGGFILPFAKRLGYEFPTINFTVKGICSVTLDPHKYGLVPIPSGVILFKDKQLQNKIKLDSYFVGTPSHTTFQGTRTGASVLATYAVMEYLGVDGFVKITEKNFRNTKFLKTELEKKGFELLMEPELNIIAVKVKNAMEILKQLEEKNIIISVSKRVDNVLRIVVTNHINQKMILNLVKELEKAKKRR